MKKVFFPFAIVLLVCGQTILAQSDTPGTVRFPTAQDSAASLFEVKDNATAKLKSSISSSATTLAVDSTTLFPSSGSLKIDNREIVFYTGKTSSTFTGVLRGREGTAAVTHAANVKVEQTIIAAHHNTLSVAIRTVETKIGTGVSTPSSGLFFRGTGSGASGWITAGLDDLSDVVITSPSNNQVLRFNGTSWVNGTLAGNGTVLSVATGNGLQGGTITESGTINLHLNSGGGLSKTLGAGSNELGVDLTFSPTWTGTQTIQKDDVQATVVTGLWLKNTTAAETPDTQRSPALRFSGTGLKSGTPAGSRAFDWYVIGEPIPGNGGIGSKLLFQWSINGSTPETSGFFEDSGDFTIFGALKFPSGSSSEISSEDGQLTLNGSTMIAPPNNTNGLFIAGQNITGSDASAAINLEATWNTTAYPSLIYASVTDTASGSTSMLIDLRVGGTRKFGVDKAGGLIIGNGTTITKHLSATTTYDPSSMADGAATSTTITVTGAATGDTCAASHTQIGTNDVLVSCHIQAANTVRVVLFNKSGGALDIASGTLRADVWKH